MQRSETTFAQGYRISGNTRKESQEIQLQNLRFQGVILFLQSMNTYVANLFAQSKARPFHAIKQISLVPFLAAWHSLAISNNFHIFSLPEPSTTSKAHHIFF